LNSLSRFVQLSKPRPLILAAFRGFHTLKHWTKRRNAPHPRIAYFYDPILSLIYGTAKPLIYQVSEVVSKILIFGTSQNRTLRHSLCLTSVLLR
jgi:hypothetical protein